MKKILKSFGSWCRTTAWPKTKASMKRFYFWSKPRLQKVWTNTKSGAKWAFTHRTEKKVWLSAAILAGFTLLTVGAIFTIRGLQAVTSGNWQISWLVWILLAFLGLVVVVLEIFAWGLVLQGTAKTKTVLKVHAWIAGIVGLPAVLIAFGHYLKAAAAMPLNWYTLLAVVVSLCLLGVIVLRAFGPRTPATQTTSSYSGSGKSGWGTLVAAVVVMYGLWMIASLFMLGKEQADRRNLGQWAAQGSMGQAGVPRHFFVTATPDAEVPVYIDTGMTCTNQLVHPNEKVWVRRTGEERFLYWKGKAVAVANLSGPHQIWFQSAETHPVLVEVSIYPRP
ncbi:MAG: hypothetical protein HYV67_01885 [Candidatus Taylorbacteria bacterium]|nr:hypothetical protein [Candidatus Taylorbacteria bacterium]